MSEELKSRAYEIACKVHAVEYTSSDRLIRYAERKRTLKRLLDNEPTDDPVYLRQLVMYFLKGMRRRDISWHQSNSRLFVR